MSKRIADLVANFRERITTVNAERQRIEAKIARLEAKRDRLPNLSVTALVKEIAEEIEPRLGGLKARVLGPFGLTSEVAIHIDGDNGRTVASISMRPVGYDESFDLRRVDHSRSSGRFPRNTIGEMNGMNFPEVTMPETIDDLVADLQQQMQDKANPETA